MPLNTAQPPVIIIGHGLSGLVAAHELALAKVPTLILDQEPRASLGGQAHWSLGGLFCVNSAEQRRMGIRDSHELALADWMGGARFTDAKTDDWPRRWAEAFVAFADGGLEKYVKALGLRFVSSVGWAEMGDGRAEGHGNSVPRFHLTWGTGPEVVRIFREPVERAAKKGLVEFRWRHRVDEVIVEGDRAVGVRGAVLEESGAKQGEASSRLEVGKFEILGAAVLVASGGIGGNLDKVRQNWPVERLGGKMPKHFVIGVPAHVDGRMLDIAQAAGGSVINQDRMWHYTEGLTNFDPIWPSHGIRVIPGPSSLWLDAEGNRLPPFLYPGTDTLATLKHICATGHDYTWFILNRTIIAREFALSGSEQNPDITGKSMLGLLHRLLSPNGTRPVQAFQHHGADFLVRPTLDALVAAMNALAADRAGPRLDPAAVRRTCARRDAQLDNPYQKDAQILLMKNARQYWPYRRGRMAPPHKILDPAHGPLIAVRMNLLTRKSLGGLETDRRANVLRPDGAPLPGLYAVGEAAGFGGGGLHGVSSLEGTFLGGCIFSGREAGRAIAEEVGGGAVEAKL